MLIHAVIAHSDPVMRQTLSRILHDLEALVTVRATYVELWDLIGRASIDFVLMDRRWLRASPTDLLPALQGLPDNPMIVLVSDVEDPKERADLLAVGCEAVLHSGLSAKALGEAIGALLHRRMESRPDLLAGGGVPETPSLSDFISNSPSMRAFMGTVRRVVRSDATLLLTGETGVGKERLAQAIHAESARGAGPFVPLNCAALPASLMESELFGHERGAFTGATNARRGAFELAHRGSIFLDEIGEIPLALQVKLLRVLQEREVPRVGGEAPVRVDVRLMAATNRDLTEEVAAGRFRRDLYYRLGVVTLSIPPLRERREDIADLARSYIDYLGPRIGSQVATIDPAALTALESYAWPGNVRELINVIERGMLLADGESLGVADLPREIAQHAGGDAWPMGGEARPTRASPVMGGSGATTAEEWATRIPGDWIDRPWREVRDEALGECERLYLDGLLRRCGGRIGETAARAGMAARSLYIKMKAHGLRKEDYKPAWPKR